MTGSPYGCGGWKIPLLKVRRFERTLSKLGMKTGLGFRSLSGADSEIPTITGAGPAGGGTAAGEPYCSVS